MKMLIFTSALLSLSVTAFAGICEKEAAKFETIYRDYSNISIPQTFDTINSAEKVFQMARAFSEVATTGPVQPGLGDLIVAEAKNLENVINIKLKDNSVLREVLWKAHIEMNYCLEKAENLKCQDSISKLVEFDSKGLMQVHSINIAGLELKEEYRTLGEKLIKLSSSGNPAQMGDFKTTLERSKELASMRLSYLEQAENEGKIRRELSQEMNNCLNSNN